MSEPKGWGSRKNRQVAPGTEESRERYLKKLAQRPTRLAKPKPRAAAWPEILGVTIIGLGLVLFPWGAFREPSRSAESVNSAPNAAIKVQTFGDVAKPCPTRLKPNEAGDRADCDTRQRDGGPPEISGRSP